MAKKVVQFDLETGLRQIMNSGEKAFRIAISRALRRRFDLQRDQAANLVDQAIEKGILIQSGNVGTNVPLYSLAPISPSH